MRRAVRLYSHCKAVRLGTNPDEVVGQTNNACIPPPIQPDLVCKIWQQRRNEHRIGRPLFAAELASLCRANTEKENAIVQMEISSHFCCLPYCRNCRWTPGQSSRTPASSNDDRLRRTTLGQGLYAGNKKDWRKNVRDSKKTYSQMEHSNSVIQHSDLENTHILK